MINEARTYLINTSATGRPPLGWYGEEYIDPNYTPTNDGNSLSTVRGILFGTSPDAITQNYRVAQYLNVIHANALGIVWALASDTRYTYNPFNEIPNQTYNNVVTPVAGNGANSIGPITTPFVGLDNLGKNWAKYTFQLIDLNADGRPEEVTITDNWLFKPTTTIALTPSGTSALYTTSQITLPGTSTMVGFSGSNDTFPCTWNLQMFSQPSRSLISIIDSVKEVSGAVDTLCGGGQKDPYKTFYNLFHTAPRTTDQLLGALLAVIYNTKYGTFNG